MSGSPPDSVMPPPERAYCLESFSSCFMVSETVTRLPLRIMPSRSQSSSSWSVTPPSSASLTMCRGVCLDSAACSAAFGSSNMSSGLGFCDSGFAHHSQRIGHPLRNTIVRMPGPSCTEKRCMLKTMPVASKSTLVSVVGSGLGMGMDSSREAPRSRARGARSLVTCSARYG